MVKRFNVVAARKYTDRNQVEKTNWLPVGTMTQFENGNQILELNHLPNQTFQIFLQEAKTQVAKQPSALDIALPDAPKDDLPTINIEEQIKAEDLPF